MQTTNPFDTVRMLGGKPQRTALVVGAGFGGMAAALRLAAKGYRVTLFDRTASLGGRAQVFERDGFRHDAGPTVITAPFLFDELFALFGRRRQDYVTFNPLNPWYRFYFPDGDHFNYGGSQAETIAEINRIEPRDVAGYQAMLKHAVKLYDRGFKRLAEVPFHSALQMLQQGPALLGLRADRSVWTMVCRYLSSPKLRQAFSIHPLLVGGSPFDTTSVFGLIHHLEAEFGVHYAVGGTGAIVAALARLMDEQGVKTRLATTVEKILIENGRACGIRLAGGETIPADIVVSNADPMHLYREMVDASALALSTRIKTRSRLSMGLFVLYFGTTRQYPEVARHTIWLGERYRELLDDIYHRKVLARDFSLYIHRPTANDSSFAPAGCDSFYVLCPVPNTQANIDWSVEGPLLQARIVAALERTIMPGLSQALTADFYMTPEDFVDRYLSFAGAGFSIAPYLTQSAWFRFHNKSEGVLNLFLTGAGTHPGPGIPGVLCSAKVVDNLVPHADAYVD